MVASKDNHTPLDVKKLDGKSVEKNSQFQTILKKRELGMSLSINKFDVILFVSIVFFIAGFSFWMYVQFFL